MEVPGKDVMWTYYGEIMPFGVSPVNYLDSMDEVMAWLGRSMDL